MRNSKPLRQLMYIKYKRTHPKQHELSAKRYRQQLRQRFED
ncbi:hypothetical protein [Nostoc sp.]